MAERPQPMEPVEGHDQLGPAAADDTELATTSPDPIGLIDQIAAAQSDPPVGVLLVGWEPPAIAEAEASTDPSASYRHQVERSIVFAVTSCAGRSDRILASAEAELAIIRSAMSGPATAEALASRLASRLETELERLAVEVDRPSVRWAVGVAVGREGDTATDLLRLAERALGDAWLLGGRRAGLI